VDPEIQNLIDEFNQGWSDAITAGTIERGALVDLKSRFDALVERVHGGMAGVSPEVIIALDTIASRLKDLVDNSRPPKDTSVPRAETYEYARVAASRMKIGPTSDPPKPPPKSTSKPKVTEIGRITVEKDIPQFYATRDFSQGHEIVTYGERFERVTKVLVQGVETILRHRTPNSIVFKLPEGVPSGAATLEFEVDDGKESPILRKLTVT
jgi:hypothetical protein